MRTKVRFVKLHKEVVAVFTDSKRGKWVDTYAHIGQHSHACSRYMASLKPAIYAEYFDLLQELYRIGYKGLTVTNRQKFTAHRPPTRGEISFGHGATHYRDFTAAQIGINAKGQLKNRFKAMEGPNVMGEMFPVWYSLR